MGLWEVLIAVVLAAGALGVFLILPLVHPLVPAVVLVAIFIWANPLFTIIEYWLTEAAFEVTIFRIVRLARLPYAEIVEVRPVRWAELFSRDLRWAQSLGNNIFRPLVLVRLRSGRRPCAIITPAETDGFVAALRSRMPSGGGPEAPAPGHAG